MIVIRVDFVDVVLDDILAEEKEPPCVKNL